MSKTVTMNVRLDEATRKELKEFAEEVGIPATSLVNATIKQMLRSREITLSSSLEPTTYLQGLIREAEADYASGRVNTVVNDSELEDYLGSL